MAGCTGNCCCHGAANASMGAGAALPGADIATSLFIVEGVDCVDCAAKIENGLRGLKGVEAVRFNYATARLRVTYAKTAVRPADVTKMLAGFGYQALLIEMDGSEGLHRSVFRLSGLDCGECALSLEWKVAALNGVQSAAVSFGAGKMTVEHSLKDEAIIKVVEQSGYKVEAGAGGPAAKKAWWAEPRTLATAVSGILLALAAISGWLGVNAAVATGVYAAAIVIGGYHAAKSGFYGLRARTLDMNFLMTAAIIGAAAIGQWSEGATVAFLFSLGNTLQTYTLDKTRRSIRALMELAPPEALVRRDGREIKLPVAEIAIGDIVVVRPGERIAMDGTVAAGCSAVNQAAITGESMPVDKSCGDAVYAGTINGQGALEIVVAKTAADSTLAKIMHMVEEAQDQKAPSQQFVDRFARYYTPAVLLTAAGVATVPWLLGQSFIPWFYKGLVLLVIACPCALVISTPVSIVAAIGNASRRGVLIKGGAYLEQLGPIQAIAFDKTGTLTAGRPVVTDILPLDGLEKEALLATAAAVEKWSEHPLALAVVDGAGGLDLAPVTNFQALPGRGAKAELDGQLVYVGNVRLFEELGQSIAGCQEQLAALQRQGKTAMIVGSGNALLGIIAVADTVRPEGGSAVAALRRAGMRHVAMLTGDTRPVAAAIADFLKLDEFYSDLLPKDKAAAVHKIRRHYGSVVMVGDGVNDAPALAAADIGIAMGVAGSDAALETADIVLMTDDLDKLSYTVRLSRRTLAVIKQNIAFAIIVKAVFIILTFAGLANLWLAVFADTGASLLVTLNGMRLMRRLDLPA